MVPQVLASGQHDVLVLQAPSVVLTNLPSNTAHEYASKQAREASYQLVKVAVDALKENKSLKKKRSARLLLVGISGMKQTNMQMRSSMKH